MDTKALRQKILDLAIHGKLVPQDPNDEPASVLLERIKAEKERLIKEGKIKRSKKSAKTSDTPHYENVPFEVPDNWVWMTLGEVGTWQSGGTPSRSNKTYYGGNIPWLKTGDLNDGLISDIPESITEEAVANSSAKINPAGSVLIAMYGATIGKLGILTFPATTNQACCACIEFNAITQLYLFYFLLSQRNGFIAKGGGGAQPNISKEIIVNTFIPLPPLSEQQRIVMEIEKWFALIDQVEQGKADLQNTIKQTKSKILDLAIHGKLVPQDPNDEPAIKLLKRINPDFTPCDNGHYTQLPDGWTFCRLDQIIGYEQSTAYIVESTAYDDSYSTPVLTAGKSFIIGYTNEATGIYSNLPCIIFDDFTTDSKLVDFPFKVKSSAMKILKVHKDIEVDYVAMFMSITKLVGDTHKRYWISEYSKLEIPIPSKAEQKRIIHAIHGIFTQLDLIMESL
ncbi:restriction endonuclease subunit S [Bacteroides thetaiotaomicron]|mgnify:CR=1 FL=1|uniref:restriction endonuclease subunit S n=1 Tax=Bacteroides thetaiotaomicron TaxID=818 RepID=UPI001CE2FBEF|nr:restriction endonuclease subunit S [Bacteroides thetaiotaomicron]MCS2840853.1 restriction endonuclease subunit S [Bacteroides thetaiotaomicron]MDC2249428.1 restriction endonuclease subunit S [Bacteroides thetaiotaomicron]